LQKIWKIKKLFLPLIKIKVMIKIFKVTYVNGIFTLLDELPENVVKCIRSLNIHEIDFDEYSALYFGTEEELFKFHNEINAYKHIISKIENLTDEFHLGEIKLDVEDKKILNEYLLKNIDINDILDKINIYGISSLNKLDKHILDGSK
jgi:hypothetical protein